MGGPLLRVLRRGDRVGAAALRGEHRLVGTYHVVGALADGDFLPRRACCGARRASARRTSRSPSPRWCRSSCSSRRAATSATLGDLYAFGLLGAFFLSSISLDRVRIAEGRTGLALLARHRDDRARGDRLGHEPLREARRDALRRLADARHAGLRLRCQRGDLGCAAARRRRSRPRRPSGSPREKPAAAQILTLAEAVDLTPDLRAAHARLPARARTSGCSRKRPRTARARKENDIAVLFVEEVPGLFVPRDTEPSPYARARARGGRRVAQRARRHRGADLAPRAGRRRGDRRRRQRASVSKAILVGTSQRGTLWRLLRGNVIGRD